MDLQNINSTFSPKSDLILADLMKKYNLGEPGDLAELILTKLTMSLSRKEIIENEVVELIKSELKLSEQDAKEIVAEIKNNIIPTLWDKMPEKERDLLLNGEKKSEKIPETIEKKPAFLDVEENKKLLKEEIKIPELRSEKIETPKTPVRRSSRLPKKPLQQPQQKSSGPDKYREPV